MLAVDIIAKKRDGEELTTQELQWLVSGFLAGKVPDYQMSAWLMAVYLKGMTVKETVALTEVFLTSGQQMNLGDLPRPTVDKHSTGGVGDKTSLILAPLLAAAGVIVAKLSGRGLGHTGGTIDKLESIPGFSVDLSQDKYMQNLREYGLSMIGAGPTLAPADKRIYALRDVTATVGHPALIASSIMSKKLAGGAQHIVLDVKYGKGALMPTMEQARDLANNMISIGEHFGRNMTAVLSDMNQPLGYTVGNSLEVKEAIDVLQNRGPADVQELILTLGAELLVSASVSADIGTARKKLKQLLVDGSAWRKFLQFVAAQGGNMQHLQSPDLLTASDERLTIAAPSSGYVADLDALTIGRSTLLLGAGRTQQDSVLDLAAGIVLLKKRGAAVQAGESLAILHGSSQEALQAAAAVASSAWIITAKEPDARPLIGAIIRPE